VTFSITEASFEELEDMARRLKRTAEDLREMLTWVEEMDMIVNPDAPVTLLNTAVEQGVTRYYNHPHENLHNEERGL
jgi:hypothetical protein